MKSFVKEGEKEGCAREREREREGLKYKGWVRVMGARWVRYM